MASKKITAMPNLAGAQVPTDLATLVDLSAVPASQNVKSTLNDLFAEITKNITDVSLQFGDGVAAAVSAASKGKIRYNATAQAFQVSENAGAYASLLKGAGAAGQVGYFSATATLTGSNNLFYDSVNVRLGVGVGTSPAAPVHVETDVSSLAVRVTDTATTLNADFSASGGVAFLGTTTTHPLELWTDGTTRVRIESGGTVGINTTTPSAQLDVVSGAAGTVGLIISSAASPSVDIFRVRNNATTVFTIDSTGAAIVTQAAATAFAVGPNGNTNPALRVVTSVASAATGLSITGNAAGSGAALTVLSSGSNDRLLLNAKGSSGIRLNTTSTFVGSSTEPLLQFVDTRGFWLANNGIVFRDGTAAQAWSLGGGSTATWTLIANGRIGFASGADASGGINDTDFVRASASVFRVANGGTGAGSLLIAPSTTTAAAQLHVATSNATTAAITNQAVLEALSTGTPAAGFGPGLQFNGQSSTTAAQNMARVAAVWTNATHAFRTSALTFSLVNLAAAQTEYGRWTPDTLVVHAGTNPTVYTSGSAIVKFYVIDDVTPPMAVNAFFTATAGSCARFQTLRGRGSNASPAAVQNGDALGAYEFVGMYSTTANSFGVGARIVAAATETWTSTANGTDLQFHTANNGGTITEKMTLTRTGTLRINPSGSYSGFTPNTLLQVGNYASWANATIAGIFAQAVGNRVLDLIGAAGQTADIIKAFNDTAGVDLFNLTAAGIVASVAGASTSQVRHGGVLKVNTTAASNVSTTATDLISYSLPASTLNTNNDFIEIEAWGTYAANANNKTVTLEFGGTTIYTTGAIAQNGGAWSIKARVVRTGATTQDAIATIIASGLVGDDATFTTPAETLSSAVTIKCTATGGASSDITQEGLIVKWYPTN